MAGKRDVARARSRSRVILSVHSLDDGPQNGVAAQRAMSQAWLNPTREGELKGAREAAELGLIGELLNLRRVMADFRRRLVAVDPAQQAELDDWLRTGGQARVASFMSAAWTDAYTLDNLVVSWREDSDMPYTLRVDACSYLNWAGKEHLSFKHGLNHKDVVMLTEDSSLSSEEATALKEKYSRSTVKVGDEAWNEEWPALADFFAVLRRDQSGKSFGRPRLAALMREADTFKSLSLGEAVMAYAGRRIVEHHQLGYGITSGPVAGTPDTNIKEGDDVKVKKTIEGKKGLMLLVTGFDHSMKYFTIDPGFFNKDKWSGVRQRVIDWAGPLGVIFANALEGREAPGMDRLLQAEVEDDRAMMAAFLEPILSGFTPVPVRLEWSGECFVNFRLWLEAMAKGVAAGTVSIRTYHESMMLDHEREKARKLEEKKDATTWVPVFDPHRGNKPGGGGEDGGRPLGTPDPK